MRDASASHDSELRLDVLPSLPQSRTICDIAPRLWQDRHVVAIWLGGSFATGKADQYSDIDLRLAVPPDDLARWESPDFAALFGAEPLARHLIRLGEQTLLHHMVLANGDILDLVIEAIGATPLFEPTVLLGSRNPDVTARLMVSSTSPALDESPAIGEAVREVIVSFWVNSHKHRKVLHRGLDLMFPAAQHANWQMLMRLWYVAATGNEPSPQHFSGIHGLTALVGAVKRAYGDEPSRVCGMPTRTREEIYAFIERCQDVVAPLGRTLAARYGFAYPAELEAVVRLEWQAFRATEI